MRTRSRCFVLIVCLALVSLSCGLFDSLGDTFNEVAGQLEEAVASETPKPTRTPRPTQTDPPVEEPAVEPGESSLVLEGDAFSADYQGSCNTDVIITGVDNDTFSTTGTLSMRDGGFSLFCYGARHTWQGTLTYSGYTFSSTADDPLVFVLTADQSYEYSSGSGTVSLPNGMTVRLGNAPADDLGPTREAPVEATEEAVEEPLIMEWDFSAPDSVWFYGESTYDTGSLLSERLEGSYRFTSHCYDTYYMSQVLPGLEPQQDFYLEATADVLSGPDAISYGIYFRLDRATLEETGNFYMYYFGISEAMGQYVVPGWEGSASIQHIPWTASNAIDTGGPNKLGVLAVGNHYSLFINEVLVDEFDGNPEITGGTWGLASELWGEGNVSVVVFDDVKFVEIPQGSSTVPMGANAQPGEETQVGTVTLRVDDAILGSSYNGMQPGDLQSGEKVLAVNLVVTAGDAQDLYDMEVWVTDEGGTRYDDGATLQTGDVTTYLYSVSPSASTFTLNFSPGVTMDLTSILK